MEAVFLPSVCSYRGPESGLFVHREVNKEGISMVTYKIVPQCCSHSWGAIYCLQREGTLQQLEGSAEEYDSNDMVRPA